MTASGLLRSEVVTLEIFLDVERAWVSDPVTPYIHNTEKLCTDPTFTFGKPTQKCFQKFPSVDT